MCFQLLLFIICFAHPYFKHFKCELIPKFNKVLEYLSWEQFKGCETLSIGCMIISLGLVGVSVSCSGLYPSIHTHQDSSHTRAGVSDTTWWRWWLFVFSAIISGFLAGCQYFSSEESFECQFDPTWWMFPWWMLSDWFSGGKIQGIVIFLLLVPVTVFPDPVWGWAGCFSRFAMSPAGLLLTSKGISCFAVWDPGGFRSTAFSVDMLTVAGLNCVGASARRLITLTPPLWFVCLLFCFCAYRFTTPLPFIFLQFHSHVFLLLIPLSHFESCH